MPKVIKVILGRLARWGRSDLRVSSGRRGPEEQSDTWELLVEWVSRGNLVLQVMRAIRDHRAPWGLQDQKVKRASRATMGKSRVLLVLQVT